MTTYVDFLPNFCIILSKHESFPILVAEYTFSTGNNGPSPNNKIFVSAATN